MESFLVSDDFAMFQTESLPVPGANLGTDHHACWQVDREYEAP